MTISVCVAGLVAEGKITQGKAAEVDRVYRRQFAALRHTMGMMAAAAEASERAIAFVEADGVHRARQALLQVGAQKRWLDDAQAAAGGAGRPIPKRFAEERLVELDGTRKGLKRQALAMMHGILAKHHRDALGRVRDRAGLDDLLEAVWGRETASLAARELADAWKQTGEWLRSRFNAAGGRIAKLDSWHLPQRHDMRAVLDAQFGPWRDFLVPLLDRAKMIDRETGLPFTDEGLDDVLREMWKAIATDGWSRNEPGGIHGVGALANSRADARVLHFAGPEEWKAYAERFGGGGTPLDAMLAHVESMTRDIAAMEAMGPNPAATLRWQQDWLRKSAAEALETGRAGDKARDGAEAGVLGLQQLFDEYTGSANRPVNRRLALGFSIFRAQQVAAKLGGAALSIGGDWGTMIHTARFDGIPAHKALARYVSMLNPANAEDRAMAAQLGLVAESWTSAMAGQWRTTGEELAHETARRVAEGVLRVSGLVAHTDIAQQAFGMEMLATLARERGKAFADLDPRLQRLLERYRLSGARWDALRSVPLKDHKGVGWLYPETVAETDQGLADDLMRMLATEADTAIPVPDIRTRAFINANLPRGTWRGELLRSAFLFKGFPLSILNLHGRRMLELSGGERWKYGLSLLALTTIGGALSLQLKAIAAGKDPLPMLEADGTPNKRFWARAGVQGGGLGIFGDLLNSSENRFGGGIASTLLGPGAQFVDNSAGAAVRNSVAALDSDPDTDTQWAKDAAKFALSEIPGLSLWYSRLAVDRLFGDLVREWADEDVAASYRRMEKRAEDEGTRYWAPPGGRLPGRGPDLGNAIGTEKPVAQAVPM